MKKIIIDPITRIEGHLSVELEVDNGIVKDVFVRGDMFRGFETILLGRNPFDAVQITQRICGVCPISHGIESSRCVENACSVIPNTNGRLIRNIALASNFIQSHILHFYHLSALDFVDITAILKYTGKDEKLNRIKAWAQSELSERTKKNDKFIACSPFLPRYEGEDFYIKDTNLNITAIANYIKALDIRMKAHKLVAIFVGRVPHAIGLVAGGVAGLPDKQAIAMAEKILWEISDFINNSYIPDVIAVAKNYLDYLNIGHFSDFLAYGEFPQQNDGTQPYFMRGIVSNGKKSELDLSKITEQVRFSRYSSESNLHPSLGKTVADEKKENAYSWIKAPRYNGKPMEVGPLARVVINYLGGHTEIKREVDSLLSNLGISFTQFQSSLGRHASRAIEAKLLCKKISEWISLLDYNQMPRNVCEIPQSGNGAGVGEAPRGALGHWISIKNHVIENYQAVVPTTWNASPKDDSGIGGPMEQALLNISIKDEKNPIEAARVVRTFDPCLACAVHCLNNGRKISEYRVC